MTEASRGSPARSRHPRSRRRSTPRSGAVRDLHRVGGVAGAAEVDRAGDGRDGGAVRRERLEDERQHARHVAIAARVRVGDLRPVHPSAAHVLEG